MAGCCQRGTGVFDQLPVINVGRNSEAKFHEYFFCQDRERACYVRCSVCCISIPVWLM